MITTARRITFATERGTDVAGLAALFCPDLYYDRISSVNLDDLRSRGIRGLVIDLDNTLVAWRSSEIPPDVSEWASKAKKMGFTLCIASNTRRYRRLAGVASALGASYVTGVSKPRRAGFRRAVRELDLPAECVAAIGDQLLTDILCANRAGLLSIFVERISQREFVVTKFNRRLERRILDSLRKSGKLPERRMAG